MGAETQLAEGMRLIRDSAGAICARGDGLRRIRALRFQDPGFDRAVWTEICAMGWPGLLVAEADGGAGLCLRELCALAEELGAGLVPEPLIEAAASAPLLRGAALADLLGGRRVVILAEAETAAWRHDQPPQARLQHGRITGRKLFVPMAGGADGFLVTTADGPALVARAAPGVHLATAPGQDGGTLGTLSLDAAPAEPLGTDGAAAIEAATLATAAMLLGVMDRAFALTLDYLRIRRQFGVPIGSFQALAHRAAALAIQIALARAAIEAAAAAMDAGPQDDACRARVSQAKARAADAALLVTRQAVQLHGAIGYTDAHDIGLYLRKAMVLAGRYGNAAAHRARFAALAPEEEDA